jgi:hypothetical protein
VTAPARAGGSPGGAGARSPDPASGRLAAVVERLEAEHLDAVLLAGSPTSAT